MPSVSKLAANKLYQLVVSFVGEELINILIDVRCHNCKLSRLMTSACSLNALTNACVILGYRIEATDCGCYECCEGRPRAANPLTGFCQKKSMKFLVEQDLCLLAFCQKRIIYITSVLLIVI